MVLNIFGLLGLLTILIALRYAAKTRLFSDPPSLDTIYSEKAFSMKLYDLKNQVAADMRKCYEDAQKELNRIAVWIDVILILLVISIGFILLASIFQQSYDNIYGMSSDNSKTKPNPTPSPQPKPVPPSPQPGDPFKKGPVQPSTIPGSELPFGEPRTIKVIKG